MTKQEAIRHLQAARLMLLGKDGQPISTDLYDALTVAIEALEQSTVDAVHVRHGHWETKKDPFGFFDEIPVCSECGCIPKYREETMFCEHCGAKMDGADGERKVGEA